MTTRYFLSSVNSDLSGGADFNKAFEDDPLFPSALTVNIAASATETSYGFTEALVPGRRGSVGLQEYRLSVEVAVAGNMELKVRLRRVAADGTVIASSDQTAAQSLNSTGARLFEIYTDLGIFGQGDRLRVDYEFTDLSGAGTSVDLTLNSGETWILVPWHAGLLRPAMREALESAYVEGVWLVELDLPSPDVGGPAATVRGALAGATTEIGGYPAKVSSIGRIPMGVSLTTHGMETPEVDIQWEDTDKEISRIVEGPNGDDVIGSAVRIRFAVAGLSEADWHTRFTGVIRRHPFSSENLTWSITAGPDDRKLTKGEVPRFYITNSDFPSAPEESVGLTLPNVLGIWSSVGVSGVGAVPTIYVDTVNFRYLVAHGLIDEIIRVYKDGLLLSSAAWNRVNLAVNGKNYTLIEFASDQGESEITADVAGYTDIVSGDAFELPIQVLYTWLENFVFLDGAAGITSVFVPTNMNDDAIRHLRDFYESSFGLVAAKYVSRSESPDSYLSSFLSSWNYRAWFGPDGRIVIKPIDHRGTAVYLDEPWARGLEDESEPLQVTYEDQYLVDRITAAFLQDAVAGGTTRSLEVREPSKDHNVGDSFDMSWGPARIV